MFNLRPSQSSSRARGLIIQITATSVAVGLLVTAVPAAQGASKTTAKSSASKGKSSTSGSTGSSASKTDAASSTTKAPAARTPANDLNGWEVLANNEWPKALDGVRAKSINASITVYKAPDLFSQALRMDSGKSAYGPIAFLALGRRGDFVRVLLPLRPNDSIGYVRASDVTLDRLPYRVVIEVDRNLLTAESADGTILSAKVAIGTNNTPTPTGLFYVKEVVPQANPGGALGPVALGLSGLSNALRTFAGGYGRVAIHGTNAPGKLGGDVSHGCVRMDNVSIAKLAKILPLGTPVEIIRSRSELVPDTARVASAWIDAAPVEAAFSAVAPTAAAGDAPTTTTTTTVAGAVPVATPTAVPVAATVAPTTTVAL